MSQICVGPCISLMKANQDLPLPTESRFSSVVHEELEEGRTERREQFIRPTVCWVLDSTLGFLFVCWVGNVRGLGSQR